MSLVVFKPWVLNWAHHVSVCPGVERGMCLGVPKEEIGKFSKERCEYYDA
jgi:hypothetical protein